MRGLLLRLQGLPAVHAGIRSHRSLSGGVLHYGSLTESNLLRWRSGGQLPRLGWRTIRRVGDRVARCIRSVRGRSYRQHRSRGPGCAKYTFSAGYAQTLNLPNGGSLRGRVSSQLVAGHYIANENTPGSYQDTYSQTDLTLTYATPGRSWRSRRLRAISRTARSWSPMRTGITGRRHRLPAGTANLRRNRQLVDEVAAVAGMSEDVGNRRATVFARRDTEGAPELSR